jgi:hypothetical protein
MSILYYTTMLPQDIEEIKSLQLFYGVGSLGGLVNALTRHIERLQHKLTLCKPRMSYLNRTREG